MRHRVTTNLTPKLGQAVEMAAAHAGLSVSAFIERSCERLFFGERPPKVRAPDRSAFTYLVRCGGFYKIGRARDVARRLSGMALPECELVASAHDAALERILHQRYRHRRARGEWFSLTAAEVEDVKKEMQLAR